MPCRSCCKGKARRRGKVRLVAIREMNPRDVEELLPMERVSSLTPWSRQMFLNELGNPLSSCFVASVEGGSPGTPSGFICFRDVGKESEILNLCVHPLYRRHGIGRRLMEFYLDRCAAGGIEISHLEVSVSNEAALNLYRSFSYEKVGLRKRFYQGKIDALLLTRKIETDRSKSEEPKIEGLKERTP
jgi:[ribosomal protein S18]-alanine N-acetyltransferase